MYMKCINDDDDVDDGDLASGFILLVCFSIHH